MIDYVSDFGWLNSLFNTSWISIIPAFRSSFECLIYHFNMWSYGVLSNVAFLILSSVTPCGSHTALTTNQNWSGSSFPTPLNMSSLIALAILNCWFGVGEDGSEGSEASGGVSGEGNCGMRCLIKLTALLGETQAHSSPPLVEVKLKDCFLTLRYLCSQFHSASFH